METLKLTVRIYCVIANALGEILILKENIQGSFYWKFPGGGLELGEGVAQALKREVDEELNAELSAMKQIGVFPDLVLSQFAPGVQVIPIYWSGRLRHENIELLEGDMVEFKWIDALDAINLLSFQSDRWAVETYLERKATNTTNGD